MKNRKDQPEAALVTFRDVAVYFSEEEWKLLNEWQKELYKNVMKEIHHAMISLGYHIANPDVLLRVNKGNESIIWDPRDEEGSMGDSDNTTTCYPTVNPDILLRIKKEEEEDFRGWHDSGNDEVNTVSGTGLRFFNTDKYLKRKQALELSMRDQQESEEEEEEEEEEEKSSCPNSGLSFFKTDKYLKMKQAAELNLRDYQDSEEDKCTSPNSVGSFTIKEEEDYFKDQQDSGKCDRSSKAMTGEGSTNRKRKACDQIKLSEMPLRKAPSGEIKVKLLLSTEKGTHSRSELWAEKNQETSVTNMFPYDFCNSATSNLHQGMPKVKRANKFIQIAGNQSVGEFLPYHPNTQENCRPYVYGKYEKSFNQEGHLTSPRPYKGEKRYPCTECEESFTEKALLITHQRTHIRERPFQCTDCEKSFSQKVYLITHQRTHTGERPYQCTDCDKSFTQKGTLNTHQRIHTGERPYHCTQCEKSFSQRGALNIHQRTHTGERPFQCNECEKSFSDKRTLIRHQSVHRGEGPFHIIKYDENTLQWENLIAEGGTNNQVERIIIDERPQTDDESLITDGDTNTDIEKLITDEKEHREVENIITDEGTDTEVENLIIDERGYTEVDQDQV